VNEEGQETHYTTDPYGRTKQVVETVDRSGKTQTIRYDVDARGFVRGEQRQIGGDKWATTSYTYTTAGDLLQTTDAAGLITSYMYDRHGRLKQQQETDTVTGSIRLTSYDYDVMGRQTAVVRPDGSHEISVYDTNGRQVLSIDGLNHATSYRYDEAGSVIEETQYKDGASDLIPANASATTRYVYNGIGNAVIMQDPNGNVTRQSFDRNGQTLSDTRYEHPDFSDESITNRYVYDPRGLLVASTDGNGHSTTYDYDREGQQTRVTDPVGQWVDYEYSPAGFTTAERRPLGRDTEWTYDYRGNVLQEKDALGHIQTFGLDLDGRTNIEFNKLGQATSYNYDTAGRVTGTTTPGQGTYTYAYDAVGNKLAETKPVYGTTTFNYDNRDSLTAVNEPQTRTVYTYDAELNRRSQRDGNNQLTNYAYDEQGRRVAKTVVREAGTDLFTYSYDSNGNLLSETKPGGLTTLYAYDFMDRTIREDYSDGKWVAYTYDKAGNVLTRSSQEGTISYAYYDNNQLKQATYPNGDTIATNTMPTGKSPAKSLTVNVSISATIRPDVRLRIRTRMATRIRTNTTRTATLRRCTIRTVRSQAPSMSRDT